MANLTTLEILDISGNGLVDKVLNDTRVFGTQVQQQVACLNGLNTALDYD